MPDTVRYTLPAPRAGEREAVAARLWAAGAMGVWERADATVAWFEASPDAATLPDGGLLEPEPDRDWTEAWKRGVEPVRAGPFLIVPSWLEDTTPADGAEHVIVLDPGRAFGSGHHPTTRMCLRALAAAQPAGASVLDVGTGSGILAIAAAKLGADPVRALDTDPHAVATARANAARAGAAIRLSTGGVTGDEAPADVVVANLLTGTLTELAGTLGALWRRTLIVSGIDATRTDRVVRAFAAAGLPGPTATMRDDGWVALRWARS